MVTKGRTEVASLYSVRYVKHNEEEDEVLVTFKVVNKEYQKKVLQIARRDDIQYSISGEKLYVEES